MAESRETTKLHLELVFEDTVMEGPSVLSRPEANHTEEEEDAQAVVVPDRTLENRVEAVAEGLTAEDDGIEDERREVAQEAPIEDDVIEAWVIMEHSCLPVDVRVRTAGGAEGPQVHRHGRVIVRTVGKPAKAA